MPISEQRRFGSPADVVQCVRTGAVIGAVFAIGELLSPYVAMRRLLGSDIHPWLVASVIFFGGCFAGLLFGMLRPLTRRLFGAISVVTIAMFPALIALDVVRRGAIHPPFRIRWTTNALLALALGALGVLVYRFGERNKTVT